MGKHNSQNKSSNGNGNQAPGAQGSKQVVPPTAATPAAVSSQASPAVAKAKREQESQLNADQQAQAQTNQPAEGGVVGKGKVVLASTDERTLEAQVEGVKYFGQSVEVDADKADELQRILVDAGYSVERQGK